MAKRDFIYDTKAGRISLGVLAVLLMVMGVILLVLSVLLGHGGKDGFWQTLVLGVSSIIFGLFNLIVLKKRRPRAAQDVDAVEEPVAESAAASAPLPSEPDEVVVVNPTRANESEGCVLIYRQEGVLVFGDGRIPLNMITDVSISNVSNPYIPNAYHLLLKLSNGLVAHIPAGQDGEWANEALVQLREAIFKG